jgi:DNA-directed RNA polymerase III subunit RPC8
VQIPPYEFYKKNHDEIEDKINEKYANKVVPKIGLCVSMYDILKTSDGLIGHGTGNANVKGKPVKVS